MNNAKILVRVLALFLVLVICQVLYDRYSITFISTGDVVLARSINYNSVNKFRNFFWPFEKTDSIFKSSDISLINLEGPLINNCQPTKKQVSVFCGSQKNADGIKEAGINVVNIANNHIADFGERGKEQTISALEKSNILVAGASSEAVYKTVKGVKFSFLGFNEVNCGQKFCEKETNIKNQISKAKKTSDIVVVSFHWGSQYTEKISNLQSHLGHAAVDSGADIVIGNHSHWVQPTEKYKNGIIVYSHGNFIFDQQWSEETRNGIISKFVFFGKKLIYFKEIPIYINSFSQPELINKF